MSDRQEKITFFLLGGLVGGVTGFIGGKSLQNSESFANDTLPAPRKNLFSNEEKQLALSYIRFPERLNKPEQDKATCELFVVMNNGKWSKHNAHYRPAEVPDLRCAKCVFFQTPKPTCNIVDGLIDPNFVCKLWIIPEWKQKG